MIKVQGYDSLINTKPIDIDEKEKHLVKLQHVYASSISVGTSNNCLGRVVMWWSHNGRAYLWKRLWLE